MGIYKSFGMFRELKLLEGIWFFIFGLRFLL
jgi:hypothetical protein